MIRIKHSFFSISILIILLGCSEKRTFLSDEIKSINPYRTHQKLSFVSNEGTENVLLITEVRDDQFPDGMGAFLNERQFVRAFRESKTIKYGTEKRILTVLARTDKKDEKIDFCISLRDTYLQMDFVIFSDYQRRDTINLTTDFYSYDDVVLFENYPNRRISDNEISS